MRPAGDLEPKAVAADLLQVAADRLEDLRWSKSYPARRLRRLGSKLFPTAGKEFKSSSEKLVEPQAPTKEDFFGKALFVMNPEHFSENPHA